ncbi:uncharacterized protein LOC117225327 [Megalopta genalis]|uniref:uncharacterized protein LOC117225327 n=1 Tax=Megalopta genalis TaxID=115081 RepID=UPI003FD10A2B
MSCCRRPTTKKSTRKLNFCRKSVCSQPDSYSDSSSYSSDSSSSFTSSDNSSFCSECDSYDCDCYNCTSPPKRRKGKGKVKGQTLRTTKNSKTLKISKTLKPEKSPSTVVKNSRKKPARRTKRSSSSCGCSDCSCSDASSSDDDCCGCVSNKPRRKMCT